MRSKTGPEVSVSAIVMNKDHKVLAGKRVKLMQHGMYCLPGGKVEDETVEWALIREVKEETNLLVIPPVQFIGYTEHVKTDKQGRALIMYYLCNQFMGELINMDWNCQEWEWLTLEDLKNRPQVRGLEEFFISLYPNIGGREACQPQ